MSENKNDKILFATLYHYESIVHSLKELQNVDKLVLFVDSMDETQKNSYEVIEKVTEISKIKIIKEKLDVTDFSKMFKKIDKLVEKFKDEDIYVDVSHSVRTQTIGLITYFSVKYPSNFKKMTFYASWIKEVVEIPIFKSAKLNEVEIKCIKYINKNKIIMVGDLGKYLGVSTTHAYRLLSSLENDNYIEKGSDGWKCLLKGNIVLSLK